MGVIEFAEKRYKECCDNEEYEDARYWAAYSEHGFYTFACKICNMFVTQNECVAEAAAIKAWNRRTDNEAD